MRPTSRGSGRAIVSIVTAAALLNTTFAITEGLANSNAQNTSSRTFTSATTTSNGSITSSTDFVSPIPDPEDHPFAPLSWSGTLAVQLITLSAFIVLTCVLFIHLTFHSRNHIRGSMLNWLLQIGSCLTILGGLARDMNVILYFLQLQLVTYPNLFQSWSVNLGHDLQAYMWRSLQALFIYVCQLHLITLFFTKPYQIKLTLILFGTLVIILTVSGFLEALADPNLAKIADEVHNICRTTMSILFFITFMFWSIYHKLLSPKDLKQNIRPDADRLPSFTHFYVSNINNCSVSDILFWGYFTIIIAICAIAFTILETLAHYIPWATDLRTCLVGWANWASFWWWLGTLEIVEQARKGRKQKSTGSQRSRSSRTTSSGFSASRRVQTRTSPLEIEMQRITRNDRIGPGASSSSLASRSAAAYQAGIDSAPTTIIEENSNSSPSHSFYKRSMMVWLNKLFKHAKPQSQLFHPSTLPSPHHLPNTPTSVSIVDFLPNSHRAPGAGSLVSGTVAGSGTASSYYTGSIIHSSSEPPLPLQYRLRNPNDPSIPNNNEGTSNNDNRVYYSPSEPSVYYQHHIPIPSAPPIIDQVAELTSTPNPTTISSIPITTIPSITTLRHDTPTHAQDVLYEDVVDPHIPPPTYSMSVNGSDVGYRPSSPSQVSNSLLIAPTRPEEILNGNEILDDHHDDPPPSYPSRH